MIRMIQSTSAGHAKDYYSDALLKSDYYLDNQEINGGQFRGKLAARLGITGEATKEAFFALCENRHPLTDKPLTPRTKKLRRTGYDINFHCQKSVSVVHVLSKDDHILDAFQKSVNETMSDLETEARARVRTKGRDTERTTGELVWVDFTHQTARPVDDLEPDPHLHAHCYAFNATWDDEETRYKAAEFGEIKKNMPHYQALFHKRFSDKLMDLGYSIRPTRNSFEIEGVPQQVINLFSKRTDAIGRVAKEKGITDAKALSELGARTRAKKQKGLTMAELKESWRSQINSLGNIDENKIIRVVAEKITEKEEYQLTHDQLKQTEQIISARHDDQIIEKEKMTAQKCVDYALKHHFERASVVPQSKLLTTAYKFGIGWKHVSAKAIEERLAADKRLIKVADGGKLLCTTKEVLQEEKRMVELARAGQGSMAPLYMAMPEISVAGQQRAAVEHVLSTKDQVSIIRGAAGVGKTTLMVETVNLIEQAGKTVTVLAPTALASRTVLRQEGFKKAETVALFLADTKMQEQVQGQVIWMDEAGLLGVQDMNKLLTIAKDKNARVILGGDTRQHASVLRGDALRILNTVGGIKVAEVNKIYRQKNAEYREAVRHLSNGNVKMGFDKLDEIGFIKCLGASASSTKIANDYLEVLRQGKTGLVISPTHKQGEIITDEIRIKMRQAGMLGKKEIKAEKLSNLNLTEAEKSDWRNIRPGKTIQFNQNVPGIQRGSQWTVQKVAQDRITISDDAGRTMLLPQGKEAAFDLLEKTEINVAKGDQIRLTRNSQDKDKQRLNNGQVLEVMAVSKHGFITLRNPISKQLYTIDSKFGHIDHAHCITSYAAQGKTVDEVFIGQPAATFGATDAKQFYVSVSRGREKVTIYTDDKAELLEHAAKIGDRKSAMELVARDKHSSHVEHLEKQKDLQIEIRPGLDKSKIEWEIEKDWNYEPGF